MRPRIAVIALVGAGIGLAGCASPSGTSPAPSSTTSVSAGSDTTPSPTATGDSTAVTDGPALTCIGPGWNPEPAMSPFPADAATLVPCDQPHTGVRVTSWTSDATGRIATMPGTGPQQELAAMAPDVVRCHEAVAALLGSDRPTRFTPILSYTPDRATAVCDVALRNNEFTVVPQDGQRGQGTGALTEWIAPAPTPWAPPPSPSAGTLSGDLWKAYPLCLRPPYEGQPLVPAACPTVDQQEAEYRGVRYAVEAGFLNPDGAIEYPGSDTVRSLVARQCGTEPVTVPDSFGWAAGGAFTCWSRRLPRSTDEEKDAVLDPDPATLAVGTCLDYTPWYAQTTVRAADRAVPCTAPHTAVVIDSQPSINLTELPPAGWLGADAVLDYQKAQEGAEWNPDTQGSADWNWCSERMWNVAGPNVQISDSRRSLLLRSQRTTLVPRVSYLADATGTVMARCDMVNLAGYLPAVIEGINLGDAWTRVAKCVLVSTDGSFGASGFGPGWADLVSCTTPGALARSRYGELPGPSQWPGRPAAMRLAEQACSPDQVAAAAGIDPAIDDRGLSNSWANDNRFYTCGTPIVTDLAESTTASDPAAAIPGITAPPNPPTGQLTTGQIKNALLDTAQVATAIGVRPGRIDRGTAPQCRDEDGTTDCYREWEITAEVFTDVDTWLISYPSNFDPAYVLRALSEQRIGSDDDWTTNALTGTTTIVSRRASVSAPFDEAQIAAVIGAVVVVAECTTTPQPDTSTAIACAQRLAQAQADKLGAGQP